MEAEPARDKLKSLKNLSLVNSEEVDVSGMWPTLYIRGEWIKGANKFNTWALYIKQIHEYKCLPPSATLHKSSKQQNMKDDYT